MLTPRFTLEQTVTTCSIKVRAPYVRLKDLEVQVDDNVFLFHCKPYYLRLTLPGSLVENENTKSSFDTDTGEFTFVYEKQQPGEEFKDLDFITKFLTPKLEVTDQEGGRKIQILTSEGEDGAISTSTNGYGFALLGHENFSNICAEFTDVFEIDPRQVNLEERKKMRLQYEQGKFNSEHYLADLFEDEEIQEIISQPLKMNLDGENKVLFNGQDLDFLKELTNVEYQLTEEQKKYCFHGLLDILYAYCYDRRTTFFEGTSESSWTITKIASTLCYLEAFDSPKEAIVSAFRRSLIYPLYRHYNLSQQVFKDLQEILKLGGKYLIKSLIEIYHIFLTGDCGSFVLNNLFIKDYIQYVMKWPIEEWLEIVDRVQNLSIKKEDLGLNLGEIEAGYSLCKQLQNLDLDNRDRDSDDSSIDSETDSDSDDDCTESDSDTDSSSSSTDS